MCRSVLICPVEACWADADFPSVGVLQRGGYEGMGVIQCTNLIISCLWHTLLSYRVTR